MLECLYDSPIENQSTFNETFHVSSSYSIMSDIMCSDVFLYEKKVEKNSNLSGGKQLE